VPTASPAHGGHPRGCRNLCSNSAIPRRRPRRSLTSPTLCHCRLLRGTDSPHQSCPIRRVVSLPPPAFHCHAPHGTGCRRMAWPPCGGGLQQCSAASARWASSTTLPSTAASSAGKPTFPSSSSTSAFSPYAAACFTPAVSRLAVRRSTSRPPWPPPCSLALGRTGRSPAAGLCAAHPRCPAPSLVTRRETALTGRSGFVCSPRFEGISSTRIWAEYSYPGPSQPTWNSIQTRDDLGRTHPNPHEPSIQTHAYMRELGSYLVPDVNSLTKCPESITV
jgi:hypothetical protein